MQTSKFIGAILLIAGTAIGAGMLALPISTAAYGFFPSILLFILCWLFLTFTALLILEVNLWLKPGSNIISMAKQTLGIPGQAIAWITYLLLFYALMAAYLSGLNGIINSGFSSVFNLTGHWYGLVIVIIIFSGMLYLGIRQVDYVNRVFITGKALAFLALIFLIASHIKISLLLPMTFNKMWLALPVIVTSFGSHIVIPGLRVYLNNDVKKLRLAIIIGSIIPLVVYIIWEIVILGVVPANGEHGLLAVLKNGQPATGLASALNVILNKGWIATVFKCFAFFAITTSFIGVSFSLFGFLADGFNIKQTQAGRFLTLTLTFIPPLIFAVFYPNGFILALGYAGFCAVILLGTLPSLMAWSGRHWKKIATHNDYRVKGGRIALTLAILLSIVVMLVEAAPK